MFEGAYQIQRALKRGARASARAYWAAHHERAVDPAATRERLGLTRTKLEHAGYAHLDAAPHLRRHVTKALAMHLADAVWSGTERHLFRDATGNRHGLPRVGRWRDFTRLPGRARSHTKPTKWETFRLHGSLAGHRAAYTSAAGELVQPRRLHAIEPGDGISWWTYDGPLVVVFSGLGDGTLVLPVRLPTAPCNQPILDHHLADPTRWHKIDLVRYPAPQARGGWRYEAHLMVLTTPYVSPAAASRRATAAIATMDRRAGIDVNVSNVTVASHDTGRDVRVSRIARDGGAAERDRSRRRRDRRRQRELDRSRRAMNRAQYQLSKRQQKRARRRQAAGLPAVEVIPMGPRVTRADGVPVQSYRRDHTSKSFLRNLKAAAADAASSAQARRDRARAIAAKVVATHGYQLVVEDTSVAAWSRAWGTSVAAFSPSTLVAAIDREARAVAVLAGAAGGALRASTRTTALSQHCPCGARVDKRLADRVHRCAACGLVGDRDAVAAVLASFVLLGRRGEPSSARVDYDAAAHALPAIRRALCPYQGWQDTLSESTDLSARDGSFIAWRTSTPDVVRRVARRTVGTASCSTRDETGARQTTPDRARVRTDMFLKYSPLRGYLRDKS
ncbi:MAG TPA: hypothetical protein VMU47_14940 [Caldimonas sp.]|nr:hypothetical protein [Caldimonas sp.]